jgi:4-amino-4-deoxy-L-arabinose transferase-like glycosyltransferase
MHTEYDVAPAPSNAADAAIGIAAWRVRALHFWRSPADQPPWARPALLGITALAVVAYTYGIANASLETFYAGAVRSMSENWHDFFFASFDPWGTISIDKLPGAFWLQALSVRIFGFHVWAFVLPQVIEGALTVLVLYRVVRRVAGPAAGLVAALILAVSPATVLLNRGNISDSLLILLLVLAADATTRAIQSGRWQSLLLAGAFVGLAFQAKMLQAWLELPAFYLAYLLAAPAASLYRRLGHIALSVLAVLVVSLSWMSVVTLVPAHDRPYVDGSCDNSVFSQVFLYNGADRLSGDVLTQPGCRPVSPPIKTAALHLARVDLGTIHIPGGIGRFLEGSFGRLAAWLFPASVVAMVALLVRRRKGPRTDPVLSATVLWTTWLFFTWCFFASSKDLNSYYLAALIPPMAALCAMGLAEAWRARETSALARLLLMATVAGSSAFALYLVPSDAGVWTWVVVTTVVATVAALVCLAASWRKAPLPRWAVPAGFALSALALLLGPAWASSTAVSAELNPFDSPYQSASLTAQIAGSLTKAENVIPSLQTFADGFPATQAVDTAETSAVVGFDIFATGHEWLPVGGFTGQVPNPTLHQFVADVAQDKVYRVTVGVHPLTNNPDLLWVVAHCLKVSTPQGHFTEDTVTYQRYLCTDQDILAPGA